MTTPDQKNSSQVTEVQFKNIGKPRKQNNPSKVENQRPDHRVRLTPAHLVQYIRINTTHRIALLHVGTELYRPSRRTPRFPHNQVMLWRSGITFREPALSVRLDCAIMYRCSSRNLPCLGFSLVVSYGGWALLVMDYNPAMALFLQCPYRVRKRRVGCLSCIGFIVSAGNWRCRRNCTTSRR
jgi:hypothetical protein